MTASVTVVLWGAHRTDRTDSRRLRRVTGAAVALFMAGGVAIAAPGVAPAGAAAPAGASPPFTATGYFHTAQKDGRWFLVTPDGQPFYSSGIDHVSADPDTDQTTNQCPYCQTIASEYPTVSDWATATVSRLRGWGFNTLGPFTDYSTFASQMPYTVQLGMASGDDWFAQSFVTNADQVAATQVAPLANDPNLIGWYTDSELHWGPDGTSALPLLDNYLTLPAGSPGLAVAEQYKNNPNGFLYALATRYFQVTTAAIRKYDPNHLILGVKAEAQEIQPQLLEAAAPYVDVWSIDDYQLQPGLAQAVDKLWPQYLPVTPNFSSFEQYIHKPIIVAEYSFRSDQSTLPNTVPSVYSTYATQLERTEAYASYIGALYQSSPWIVGDDWFEYVDEPDGGRVPDGENDNFGVVTVGNQPYGVLTNAMRLLHQATPQYAVTSGQTCDSWATDSGTTACTATMPAPTAKLSVITDTAALAGAVVGTAYQQTVAVGGGKPTYHFSIEKGRLPPGLTLSQTTGTVSGTPKTAGTFHFTMGVTDSTTPTAESVQRSLAMTVAKAPASANNRGSVLRANGTLTANQRLAAGRYRLVMQADGNLVEYSGSRALWSSGTAGHAGAYLIVQSDGNAVVYTAQHQALWSSGTAGHPGDRLVLQPSDGNVVIYGPGGNALWATGT